MQGDSIKVALKPAQLQTNMFSFVYSTKILRRSTLILYFHKCYTVPTNLNTRHHVFGDPGFDCREYSSISTYDNCIHKVFKTIRFHLEEQQQNYYYQEVIDLFKDTLGCMPPLLAHDSLKTCNRKLSLFWSLIKS